MPNRSFRPTAHKGAVPWRVIGFAALALAAFPASAQETAGEGESKPEGLWEHDTLTGDWNGVRSDLADRGLAFALIETDELLGNVSGGVRRGFNYMGRTEADIDLDLEKLAGWHGGLIHISGYQIHGRGLASNNLGGNLLGPSNIEATRTTRLFDAYYQQSLLDDKVSIRAGQFAADEEFAVSQYSSTFLNSTFGWPGMLANDLPDGGPAYPLATPGLRVKFQPNEAWSWQTAVFNGRPGGGTQGSENPQIRNRDGLAFSTDQDAFVISELGYQRAPGEHTLAGTYKLGVWYHSADFQDSRDPARTYGSNYGVYGVVDQMLLPKAGGAEGTGLAAFLRAGVAPDDRNLVSAYLDGGLNYKGPFTGRDSDVAGIGIAYAKAGSHVTDADRDYNGANPLATRPVRDYELAIEATYQFVAAPWWTIQPDAQYIIHPGANRADPDADEAVSAPAMKDAFVLGVRSTIKF